MNITEKLELSKQPNSLHFFHEGVFVHVYYSSIYIVIKHLGWPLKVSLIDSKQQEGKCYLRAGLPIKSPLKKLPNLERTDYGYKLIGSWNMQECTNWYRQQLHLLNYARNGFNSSMALMLTSEQSDFLSSYRPENYPASTSFNFLLMLKEQLYQSIK